MLVGVAGFAHSGKDTTCDILRHHGLVSRRHAFADPIKQTCNALFGWDDRHAFGDLKEVDCSISFDTIADNWEQFVRTINQYGLDTWGMDHYQIYHCLMSYLKVVEAKEGENATVATSPREVYQVFGTEVGRERLHNDVWVLSAPVDDVCIPDVRFHNECDYLRSKGATIIRINRGECKPVRPHASESYISELNVTDEYDNEGSLYDLETWVMDYFKIDPNSPRLFPDE